MASLLLSCKLLTSCRSIYFHTTVLDLFRSSLHQNPKQALDLDTFTADHRNVEDVCLASKNQLKNLVLVFRTRYASAISSVLWHTALLYVANDCFLAPPEPLPEPTMAAAELRRQGVAMTEDSKRVWYLACIDGYKALAAQFGFIRHILQGLLGLGISKGLITAAEGRAHMHGVNRIQRARRPSRVPAAYVQPVWMIFPAVAGPAQAATGGLNFILDLHAAMEDPVAASVEALSRSFEKIVMFDGEGGSSEQE